jgi:hypothetical protein
MEVSKNAYYHWLKRKDVIKTKASKLLLKDRILFHFNNSRKIYGSCRIQKKLERENIIYSRSYIALLMRSMGLRSVFKRKFVPTTDSNHSFSLADNKLDRDFTSLK